MEIILFKHQFAKVLKISFLVTAVFIMFFLYKKVQPASKINNKNNIINDIKQTGENYELSMENTTFKGVSRDSIPYSINAEKAIKSAPDVYKLENLEAIYLLNGEELKIISNEGKLNNLKNLIDLNGEIKGLLQDFVLTTDSLQINLLTHEVFCNNKVKIDYKNSEINANTLNIQEDNILYFEGNVSTKINLPKN